MPDVTITLSDRAYGVFQKTAESTGVQMEVAMSALLEEASVVAEVIMARAATDPEAFKHRDDLTPAELYVAGGVERAMERAKRHSSGVEGAS